MARGVVSGRQDRTKILTPFVLSMVSSWTFATMVIAALLALSLRLDECQRFIGLFTDALYGEDAH
jgi:hypothetical protein